MNRKGQIGQREIITIIVVVILLSIIFPIFTGIINAASSGNIDQSLDAIVNALIPLFIFAMFVEFLRGFFR